MGQRGLEVDGVRHLKAPVSPRLKLATLHLVPPSLATLHSVPGPTCNGTVLITVDCIGAVFPDGGQPQPPTGPSGSRSVAFFPWGRSIAPEVSHGTSGTKSP